MRAFTNHETTCSTLSPEALGCSSFCQRPTGRVVRLVPHAAHRTRGCHTAGWQVLTCARSQLGFDAAIRIQSGHWVRERTYGRRATRGHGCCVVFCVQAHFLIIKKGPRAQFAKSLSLGLGLVRIPCSCTADFAKTQLFIQKCCQKNVPGRSFQPSSATVVWPREE